MKKLLLLLLVFTALPLCAQSRLEIAYEISDYAYREPSEYTMTLKGHMQGGSLRYETRFDASPIYYAVDGRWMGGSTDYDGWLQNGRGEIVAKSQTYDIGDYYYEGRLHMGRVADLSDKSQLWWAAGFGYRYLKDHMNKDAQYGYLRESNYVYMPFTAEYRYNGGTWELDLKGELDYLLFGWQNSHMDIVVRNDQHQGFGVRVSAKIQVNLDGKKTGVFVEPFYRRWEIQDSEPNGGIYEPHNTTDEFGVRVGMTF